MLIPHPLLGPRDASEFVYKGDAALMNRPDGFADDAPEAFVQYAYQRSNPLGAHR